MFAFANRLSTMLAAAVASVFLLVALHKSLERVLVVIEGHIVLTLSQIEIPSSLFAAAMP